MNKEKSLPCELVLSKEEEKQGTYLVKYPRKYNKYKVVSTLTKTSTL